ncbi:unnamed protein product [Rodentolepis nana]|uniref:Uncharacterized protein n=1 Tax=Rodentolepis nana TaxID=102285 RepID=A0A0R3TST8_RODNA|nr:unnamed protein product [Rodentolepis nana]
MRNFTNLLDYFPLFIVCFIRIVTIVVKKCKVEFVLQSSVNIIMTNPIQNF